MNLREEFLSEIETFMAAKQMDATTFGREALKDPSFVFELRDGRSPNLRTVERVREYMEGALQDESGPTPPQRAGAAV